MHQKLIGHKGRINLEIIEVYAEEVGLNVKKLMDDINKVDTKYIEKIVINIVTTHLIDNFMKFFLFVQKYPVV